jgi:benzylsuccinate CoA-transferase BbsF subunit
MLVTGNEGDPPISVSNSWNDFIGGLHAAFAVLHALMKGEGRGAYLDLAQAECSIATLGPLALYSAATGRDPVRLGNRSTSSAPQGCYPCAGNDEWCVISVQDDAQWLALTKVMGSAALGSDPRFASVTGRLHFQDEIDKQIAAWTRNLPKEEVQARLAAAGVPAERVRRADEVVDSDDAGHVFHPVLSPGASKPDLAAGLPFSLGISQTLAPEPPVAIGKDTREALREWIGLTDAEIDELEAAGALA